LELPRTRVCHGSGHASHIANHPAARLNFYQCNNSQDSDQMLHSDKDEHVLIVSYVQYRG